MMALCPWLVAVAIAVAAAGAGTAPPLVHITEWQTADVARGGGVAVTTQAWCDNSLRIRAAPDPFPPAAAATKARFDAMMRERGMGSLPDAFKGVACTPGASAARCVAQSACSCAWAREHGPDEAGAFDDRSAAKAVESRC